MLQNLRAQVQRQPSAVASPARWWVASIGLAVAVGIAYFLAARLSLYLLTKPDGVAVFWPAAGVSSGVLIALGRDARWPVAAGTMVATIVANLMGDRNVWSAFAFALCNAGEPLLTAWLIERYFGLNFSLDRLRHVLGLVAAAIVGDLCFGGRRDRGVQSAAQPGGAGLHHLAALVCIRCDRHHYGCTAGDRARFGLAQTAASQRAHRRHYGTRGGGRDDRNYQFRCRRSRGGPWCRSRCCSRCCCGLRLVAGRSSPRRLRSSCRSRSLGRSPSASGISATPVSWWRTASWAPNPASWECRSARSFLLRFSPSGVSTRPCSWRAKRGCRKRWRPGR